MVTPPLKYVLVKTGIVVDYLPVVVSLRRSYQDDFPTTITDEVRVYEGQISRIDET